MLLFLGELSTCPQNCILTRSVEPQEKNCFVIGGTQKPTYKGRFLNKDISITKYFIENPNTCELVLSYHG
jgi:hypothetical protein